MSSSASSTKQILFSPGVRSWVLSLVAGIIIPLFTFPLLVEHVRLIISHIPLDAETGIIYGSNTELFVGAAILLVIFVAYLTIILYQVWLSATRLDFKLSLPVLLTIAGPVAIMMFLNLS